MKKIISIILGILLLGTTNIYGWTKYGGDIGLQKVTPGTQQIGNLNISGVGILSDITLQDTTPLITLTDTTAGDNDWSIKVDADIISLIDDTQGLTRLSMDSTGTLSNLATYGNERVIDGSFSVVGLTDWTLGAGWTDGTGTAAKSADGTGTLTQAVAINAVIGTLYKITYTISNWSVGTVNMIYGAVIFPNKSANGTYTEYVWAFLTNSIIFTPTNTSRFNIDNVSVTTVSSGGASVLEGVTTLRNYIQIDSSIGFFKEVGDEDLALYLDGSQRWRLDLPDLGGITKLSLLGNGTIYSYAQALKLQAGTDQLIQIAN